MQRRRSVPIAALQHFVFCPRQCALIHNEQVWAENALTMFGHIEHERVDSSESSYRKKVKEERSVHLCSERLGLHGISDVVEYHLTEDGIVIVPVEYKHGKPKNHAADEVQLCAQALCLEEVKGVRISKGYIYYHSICHRIEVDFSEELRVLTEKITEQTRELLESGGLPDAIKRQECESCSLYDLCLPKPNNIMASKVNDNLFSQIMGDEETS